MACKEKFSPIQLMKRHIMIELTHISERESGKRERERERESDGREGAEGEHDDE